METLSGIDYNTASSVARVTKGRVRGLGRGPRSKNGQQSPSEDPAFCEQEQSMAIAEGYQQPASTSNSLQSSSLEPSTGTEPSTSETAKRGRSVRNETKGRIKWTKAMNVDVFRSFYAINNCQDEPKAGYIQAMYAHFIAKYPDLHITDRNLSDRRNYLLRSKHFTVPELIAIKREINGFLPPTHWDDKMEDSRSGKGYNAACSVGRIHKGRGRIPRVNNSQQPVYPNPIFCHPGQSMMIPVLGHHQPASTSNNSAGSDPSTSDSAKRKRSVRDETRGRMKWTKAMNVDVFRSFYTANNCQDEPKPGYIQVMFTHFIAKYPDLHITERNLSDRRNYLIRSKQFSISELNAIKREVGSLIFQPENFQENYPSNSGSFQPPSNALHPPPPPAPPPSREFSLHHNNNEQLEESLKFQFPKNSLLFRPIPDIPYQN